MKNPTVNQLIVVVMKKVDEKAYELPDVCVTAVVERRLSS